MLWLTALLIFIVSTVFAMLGLGGGMLYVPIFHWLGFGLEDVLIPLGLLLNGLNTLIALVPFGIKCLVDWKGGLPMALSALVFAPIGALVTPQIPNHLLLALFSVLVLIAAARTLWVVHRPEPEALLPFARRVVASLLGSSFMANRAKPQWVKWFYGILLIGVAGKMLWPLVF